jgi:adenosylcobinamide kinase/adenosylcobinamide-phosphate guanylyltransferase
MAVSTVTLVTGGCRSGKSRYALERAAAYGRRAFIATAEACDEEMRARIERHRAERGPDIETIEEPCDLAGALRALPGGTEVAVVDCLTIWLANLMHRHGEAEGDYPEVAEFLSAIESPPCDLLIVTNEVGLGVVPASPLGRRFRDLAGIVNQQVARRSDRVVLMACGCPITVKGQELP